MDNAAVSSGNPGASSRRGRISPVAAAGICCLAVQLAAATWLVQNFQASNISTEIALNLLATGRYEGGQTKLKGPYTDANPGFFRRYHLPGEPLYLATVFRVLPQEARRYAHVPITVLLGASVAYVASWMGGASLGLVAGLYASLQPFVVFHGPVWEDTFLAAALIWLVVALLCRQWEKGREPTVGARPPWTSLLILACATSWAALTRQESQLGLLLLAAAILVVPAMRSLRREGVILALAVGAAMVGWGLRNAIAAGEFAIGSSRDGITLWEWNSPYVRQSLRHGSPEGLSFTPEIMRTHWDRTMHMTENQVNRYYLGQALQHALAHPVEAVKTSLLKLSLTLTGISIDKPLASSRNVGAALWNLLAFSLALRGFLLLRSTLNQGRLPLACVVLVALTVPTIVALLVGPIGLRYRIAFDGILWIAGAGAILNYLRRLAVRSHAA